jgi:acetolactate synthase small subunit
MKVTNLTGTEPSDQRKWVIHVVVEDNPTSLFRIVSMLRHLGLDIASLSADFRSSENVMEITIVSRSALIHIDHIVKQLGRSVDLISVWAKTEAEIILAQVAIARIEKQKFVDRVASEQLINGNIKVVASYEDSLVVTICDSPSNIDKTIDNLMSDASLLEFAVGGTITMKFHPLTETSEA